MCPAGSLRPNDLGLFDMLGNALEYCHDKAKPYPSEAGAAVPDLEASQDAGDITNNTMRIMRGGAFRDRPDGIRCAMRVWIAPASGKYVVIRVARTHR